MLTIPQPANYKHIVLTEPPCLMFPWNTVCNSPVYCFSIQSYCLASVISNS